MKDNDIKMIILKQGIENLLAEVGLEDLEVSPQKTQGQVMFFITHPELLTFNQTELILADTKVINNPKILKLRESIQNSPLVEKLKEENRKLKQKIKDSSQYEIYYKMHQRMLHPDKK